MTNTTRRRFLQIGAALPFLSPRGLGAQAGTAETLPAILAPRRALVLGNSAYSFGPLGNPANDARAIGEQLARTGFEVVTRIDLARSEMVDAIREYSGSLAKTRAVGLFYFAGHGVQLAWRNYLLPVDAVIDRVEHIHAQCIDVNDVIERVGRAANAMNIVILDACRDHPFGPNVRLEQKGLSQLDAAPGTLLAYATAPGHVASDGERRHGLYTEHLLRELSVPDARIEDIFKRVRLAVRRMSNGAQIPWESTSLEEDFWFIPPKDAVRAARAGVELARREQLAARLRTEKLEKAQREELQRLEREQAADQIRLAEVENRRRDERERAYREEAKLWQRASAATAPGPLEDYLRRYPSGHFAELAQLRLDMMLAVRGEKRVEPITAAQNPYAQGFARANTAYKVGDSYTYSRVVGRSARSQLTQRVTRIEGDAVIFNDGALVLDPLGNIVKDADGQRFTPRQDLPLEYAIGRKWTTRFTVTNAKRGSYADSGFFAYSELTLRVTRRETVTVPAGSFDCFLVEAEGYSIVGRGFRAAVRLKQWMAPDRVRRPIISEEFSQVVGRTGHVSGEVSGGRHSGYGVRIGSVLEDERIELTAFQQS